MKLFNKNGMLLITLMRLIDELRPRGIDSICRSFEFFLAIRNENGKTHFMEYALNSLRFWVVNIFTNGLSPVLEKIFGRGLPATE